MKTEIVWISRDGEFAKQYEDTPEPVVEVWDHFPEYNLMRNRYYGVDNGLPIRSMLMSQVRNQYGRELEFGEVIKIEITCKVLERKIRG